MQENNNGVEAMIAAAASAAKDTGTNIALLPPAERAVIVLDATKTEARLRELVAASADIVEVKDKDGREQAHRTAMSLRNARTAITNTGKIARDDANAFAKAVIAKEKELVAIVQGEEDRVFALRDAFDAKLAAEKAERERLEAERKQGIRAKIEAIRGLAPASYRDDSVQLTATLEDLQALAVTKDDFAEFTDEATEVRAKALVDLQDLLDKAITAEAEAKRLEEERAAIERQRAEQAAAEAERQRVAAETKRQLEAQQAAIAEQRRAEEKRLADERAAFEAEKAAFAAQQDAARKAAEQAAQEREQALVAQATEQNAVVLEDDKLHFPAHAASIDSPEVAQAKNEQTSALLDAVAEVEPVTEVSNDNVDAIIAEGTQQIESGLAADALRNAVREAILLLSPNDIRATVEDELAVAVAA